MQFCFEPKADCLPKEELDMSSSAASSSNRDTSVAAAALTTTASVETTERQQGWWHWVVTIVPCLSCYHSFPLCALAMERAYCTQQQMIMTKMDSCEVGFIGGM
ncbi:hypothetical protein BDL97_17G029700 [Sphagnum fallax]|nr:hypothetical protein BDL97_17G029700 [Sphagnum fallax]